MTQSNESATPAPTTPSPTISRPVCPADVHPLSPQARVALFGAFDFEAAPLPGDKEHVKVLGDWRKRNIRGAHLPAFGGRAARVVGVHVKIAERLEALFRAWAEDDLLGDILKWNGAYNPRFIRGSVTRLSNHAWGTAFDLNAAQNPLGSDGAVWGQPGCVWRLVPRALEQGFYPGGFFARRQDWMHFEAFR